LAIGNIVGKIVWGGGLLLGLSLRAPLYVLALPMFAAEVVKATFLVPAARAAADLRYRIKVRESIAVLLASLPYFISGMASSLGTNLALSTLEFVRKDEREVGWLSITQNIATLAMLLYPLLTAIVMPMLSRAQARSGDEMMAILRRAIEVILVLIAPVTTLISAGSDIFVRLAFGESYAPAALGLSILSLVFVMTYLSIMLCSALIISGQSWSVTVISIASIFVQAALVLVFVPIGRAIFGTGGECAGAAFAVIATEASVNLALLWRVRYAPLDRRNIHVLLKTAVVSGAVLVANRFLFKLGAVRLPIDMALYVALALATRLVRFSEARRAAEILWEARPRRGAAQLVG
jgi:O-antigen/teichoic acid export membrane protein